nr:hypothetical protein [Pseudodesulfovibrio sp.]
MNPATFHCYRSKKDQDRIRFSLILRILKEFPEVNRNWLLFGEGEMFDQRELAKKGKAFPLAPHQDTEAQIETPVADALGPVSKAVATLEHALLTVDPDATEPELLENVINHLANRRRKLSPKSYGYPTAKEPPITMAHEDNANYTGDACGIDAEPPTSRVQFLTPGSKTK